MGRRRGGVHRRGFGQCKEATCMHTCMPMSVAGSAQWEAAAITACVLIQLRCYQLAVIAVACLCAAYSTEEGRLGQEAAHAADNRGQRAACS
jgi:hypothetical protein